jgi:hypothetical protein
MGNLNLVYDIIEYENGPSQIVGELGPSPGRLAHNSRANVARQVLDIAMQPDRTMMGDTDFRRVRIERDTFRATSETLRNDNRYLRSQF